MVYSLKTRKKKARPTDKLFTSRTKHYLTKECVPVSEDWVKWAFSMMKWECGKEKQKMDFFMFVAARGGSKDALIWLKSQGCALNVHASEGATFGGHLKLLKYLKSKGIPFSSKTCWK